MTNCACDSIKPGSSISVEDALHTLLANAITVNDIEQISIAGALHRVLAQSCTSAINVPPADNSAMDGYALRSSDTKADLNYYPLSQRVCAGDYAEPLTPGTAARIFTGAVIPKGADTVIMQEKVTLKDDLVGIEGILTAGSNIRKAGEDILKGAIVLEKGTRLRAQELGLIASTGIASLNVYRKLKVGVFFTGNELVEPGELLKPGKIYNSNQYVLCGLLEAMGCEIVNPGIVEDTLAATKETILNISTKVDIIVTTGGVSVGEEDYVLTAVEELGNLSMWKVAMKPGKPVAFGHINNTPFFGLPGNPVSVFTTFYLFAAPFIKKMQGINDCKARAIPVKTAFSWPKVKRQEYLRVKLKIDEHTQTTAHCFPHQGSGVLTSTSWADGFAEIPPGVKIEVGDTINYFSFTDLL